MGENYSVLPAGLPEPEDDGAAQHLVGMPLPDISLETSTGETTSLRSLGNQLILYVFPQLASPFASLPLQWDNQPGARGCTVQSLAFKSVHPTLAAAGFTIAGVSAQSPTELAEAQTRLELPQLLFSDAKGLLRNHLQLPVFNLSGASYLKRMTLLIEQKVITRCWYPIFPPGADATELAQLCKDREPLH